jgi:hydroxymethylbilane synthase
MNKIRIGSRTSKLALAQAQIVAEALKQKFPDLDIEIVGIKTGEEKYKKSLSRKDIFVKEIEEALIKGDIDLAVHSMKDLPIQISDELVIASVPKREDPRDAFISKKYSSLFELPEGAKIGTSSLRRRVQILNIRPDLNVVEIRGNVDTRIKKLDILNLDAILLACAGLKRLGLDNIIKEILDPDLIVPAIGQGALAIEARKKDNEMIKIAKTIEDRESRIAIEAERIFAQKIGGGCNLPVAAYAKVNDKEFVMNAMVAYDNEGKKVMKDKIKGNIDDALTLASKLADKLLIEDHKSE